MTRHAIRKCPDCDQPTPAPDFYDHASGCPSDPAQLAREDERERCAKLGDEAWSAGLTLRQFVSALRLKDGTRAGR